MTVAKDNCRSGQPGHSGHAEEADDAGCLITDKSRWHGLSKDWRTSSICLRVILPLLITLVILAELAIFSAYGLIASENGSLIPLLSLIAILFCGGLVLYAFINLRRSLLLPLAHVRDWVSRVRTGEFTARMPALAQGEPAELATNINRLANVIEALSKDLETEAKAQSIILERKTQSLELLYELTASMNESFVLDDLLTQFLHKLAGVTHANAGSVYLREATGERRVSYFGLNDTPLSLKAEPQRERVIELRSSDSSQPGSAQTKIIVVPLQYRETVVGYYSFRVPLAKLPLSRETENILINVGRHLGVAIEQSRLNEEADRLALVEERTRLANELHDSLAQTVASLRFQVRVLDETLHQGVESSVWRELEKTENSIDQANQEVRELIARFRAPMIQQDVVVSVQKLVNKFKSETGISTFFQNEWQEDDLSADQRTDLIRIVQEALNNIRKHASAKTVRVMIRHGNGRYRLLVEDDGVGISSAGVQTSTPGEHIGLTIMQERAESLGADFNVDGEAGEGTRVSVQSQSSDGPAALKQAVAS